MTARGGGGRRGGHWRREQRLAVLTPEERQQLKAAHRAAMQDPAVQAAKAQRDENRRAFRQTMRSAMLQADPTIGPVLDKLRAAAHAEGRGDRAAGGGRMHGRLANLNDEERSRLRAARQGVRNDPAVAAARQQMESATTPDDQRQARRMMAEATRNAMLRNDPSLGPVLEKLRQNSGDSSNL